MSKNKSPIYQTEIIEIVTKVKITWEPGSEEGRRLALTRAHGLLKGGKTFGVDGESGYYCAEVMP